MLREIELRQNELQLEPIKTIYFGGGTPSLLDNDELLSFFTTLHKVTDLSQVEEITLEANPDNLTKAKLNELKDSPINRLSIGIQSFFDTDLAWMNRAHNAQQAEQCLTDAKAFGFNNITIDLIYGAPTTTNQMWQDNLEKFLAFDIPHLSAYCLTVEENTVLHHQIKKGKTIAPKEQRAIEQFDILLNFTAKHNIEQYEISNFARGSNYAKHNSSYWFGTPYIGIGPSAHSFNGEQTRRFNIANNIKYCNAINANETFWQRETLSQTDQMNEFLLTQLRTKWGVSKKVFIKKFGEKKWQTLEKMLFTEVQNHNILDKNGTFTLTQQGKHIADAVTAQLFFD